MKDSYLSNENASTESQKSKRASSVRFGVVDAVFPSSGIVRVRLSANNHVDCDVMTTTSGDEWLPTVEDKAIISRQADGRNRLLGTLTDDEVLTVEGERKIGHAASDTHLKFTEDGTLEIYPDGSFLPVLTIDDEGLHLADEQVVTDIQTTTDSDGHVTDVTPIYTQTLSL